MSCGLTGCSGGLLFQPDTGSNASVEVTHLQIEPDEFEREELQSIRDRARRLSIQSSPAKTVEERLYQELADVADQLDAFVAREEAAVREMEDNVTVMPTADVHSRPFLGGYRKRR